MPHPAPDQRDRSPVIDVPADGPQSAAAAASRSRHRIRGQREIEAARERDDLDVSDLREMSVTELRQVSRDLEVDAAQGERKGRTR